MSKRWVFIIINIVLGLLYSGCGTDIEQTSTWSENSNPEISKNFVKELSLGFIAEDGLNYDDAEDFTEGEIHLNVFPGGLLGTEREMVHGVKTGTISMIVCSTSALTEYVPELALIDIPGIYNDYENCNHFLNDELHDWFQQYYNKAGFQLISWKCTGFRQLTSNRCINNIEDFNRLKLRVMKNDYHDAFWKSLGAETSAIDFVDLKYALQQGKVDAQENVIVSSIGGGLLDYQKYIIFTNHIPNISAYVMNKELYDSMSEEEKKIINDYFAFKNDELMIDLDSKANEQLDVARKDYGIEIIYLTENQQKELYSYNSVVINLLKDNLGEELVHQYLEKIGYIEP